MQNGMRLKAIAATAAIGLFGGLALSGGAHAAGKASTKVTIQGGGSVSGYVRSSDEDKCANGRKIKVYRLKNGNADLVTTDTAQVNGTRYQWSAGNPGNGKYFAKAPETSKCEGDVSKTVNVH
jgi:hypothetical protein